MLKTFTVTTFALAMLAGPVAAQNARGATLVNLQLESVASEHGLTAGTTVRGQMAQGSSQTANLAASGEVIYFIGVCDEGCSNLDMIVRDPSGREVGRDFRDDDVPAIAVNRATAGDYSVEVSMTGCTGQCHWGIGVFNP